MDDWMEDALSSFLTNDEIFNQKHHLAFYPPWKV